MKPETVWVTMNTKTSELKRGDVVTIYQDPITKQKVEGKAKLLKNIWEDDEMQRWEVRFITDGYKCERNVAPYRKK